MAELLACDDLTVTFGGLRALDGLSLKLEAGDILGLIGPNGSGKTTFFNAITGFAPCSRGSFWIDGNEMTGVRPQAIYKQGVSRTFQQARLCGELTVFDNVIVGDSRHMNMNLPWNILRRRAFASDLRGRVARVTELIGRFNADLRSSIFERADTLSVIDRRRVEVCRALIGRPRVLLLDEPSAGMTEVETRRLMDEIMAYREEVSDVAIVIVEHEMDVIRRVADRCIVMNFGQKVAEGSYEEVTNDEWVKQAYLGVA